MQVLVIHTVRGGPCLGWGGGLTIAVLDVNGRLGLQEQGYELQAAPQSGVVQSREASMGDTRPDDGNPCRPPSPILVFYT